MKRKIDVYFATCPRGLEGVLAAELHALGARETTTVPGGVGFAGEPRVCYRANLESRVASRVLMQLSRVPYRNEQDVYAAAYAVPWQDWFDVTRSIRVEVTAIRSPLRSLDYITLKLKDAVCDRFRAETGGRPDVDTRNPDVRVHAFLDRSDVTLYLDSSGEPLYKRGYRRDAGEAPLRENLAAGIVKLTGWSGSEPLFDPMCGSGTILVEAAMMALDIAPGAQRRFGFELLAHFDAATWGEVREAARARQKTPRAIALYGSDANGRELVRARENIAAAGLQDAVSLAQSNVLEVSAPAPTGVLVTNPPYGVRQDDSASLAAFYPKLGDALKSRFAGWRCYLLSADPLLPKLIHLRATKRTPLFNGALECRLYEYLMVAGEMQKHRPSPFGSALCGGDG